MNSFKRTIKSKVLFAVQKWVERYYAIDNWTLQRSLCRLRRPFVERKNENGHCLASKSRAYVLITVFTPCRLNCAQGLQQVKWSPLEKKSLPHDRVWQTLTTGVTKLKENIDNVCVASEIYHTSTHTFIVANGNEILFSVFYWSAKVMEKSRPHKHKQDNLIYITHLVFAND